MSLLEKLIHKPVSKPRPQERPWKKIPEKKLLRHLEKTSKSIVAKRV